MLESITETCDRLLRDAAVEIGTVEELTYALLPHLGSLGIESDSDLPYGRFLLHDDPKGRYHIEVHIFSRAYEGSIHCHETWGIFWLVAGTLLVSDFQRNDERTVQSSSGVLVPGAAANFFPPNSDWHKVATPAEGEQTVSLHIYGQGYDRDRGKYLDHEGQVVTGSRGAFGDNQVYLPFLKPRSK